MKQKKANAKETAMTEESANEWNILEKEVKGMASFPEHTEYHARK
jgi:hypothetical protein